MLGDDQSVVSCINDLTDSNRAPSYAMSLSTTVSASTFPLTPGIYLVFLDGLDATTNVILATAPSKDNPAVTTPTTGNLPVYSAIFPGSSIERVRIAANRQYVIAKLSVGTGTLYLVPLTLF